MDQHCNAPLDGSLSSLTRVGRKLKLTPRSPLKESPSGPKSWSKQGLESDGLVISNSKDTLKDYDFFFCTMNGVGNYWITVVPSLHFRVVSYSAVQVHFVVGKYRDNGK